MHKFLARFLTIPVAVTCLGFLCAMSLSGCILTVDPIISVSAAEDVGPTLCDTSWQTRVRKDGEGYFEFHRGTPAGGSDGTPTRSETGMPERAISPARSLAPVRSSAMAAKNVVMRRSSRLSPTSDP